VAMATMVSLLLWVWFGVSVDIMRCVIYSRVLDGFIG
jgi:hypothetical protein